MKDLQQRLDKGADALMASIKEAESLAAETCEAGDAGASKDFHMMAAYIRMAYGIGRGINIGGVQPKFGGNK